MEKTAVEWMIENMPNIGGYIPLGISLEFQAKFEQAKEMEKEQRQKDFKAGNECACMCHENIEDYFKQYIKSE